jgi:hypothetical protein
MGSGHVWLIEVGQRANRLKQPQPHLFETGAQRFVGLAEPAVLLADACSVGVRLRHNGGGVRLGFFN